MRVRVNDVPDVAPDACDLMRFIALLNMDDRVDAVGGGGGGWSEGWRTEDAVMGVRMNSGISDGGGMGA